MEALILFCLIFSVITVSAEYKSYKGFKVYSVSGSIGSIGEIEKHFKPYSEYVFFSKYGTDRKVLIAPDLVSDFENLADENNIKYTVTVEDFSELIGHERKRRDASTEFSHTEYHNVAEIHAHLKDVAAKFRGGATVVKAGKSYEGRDLLGLRINTGNAKNKPAFMIEAGVHAREWVAPAMALYFIDQLLNSKDSNIISMRDHFDWHIFPTVNPDGYQYSIDTDRMWRKTRSKSANGCYGADGNRNWAHNWGVNGSSTDPCEFEIFAGTKAFSEIEIKSLSKYATKLKVTLKVYIAFHSFGPLILFPYGDSTVHVSNFDDLINIATRGLEFADKVNGSTWDEYYGPGTAVEMTSAASGNGIDWIREALGVQLSYTIELKGENFVWPANRIPEQGDEVVQLIRGIATEAIALKYA